MITFLTENGYTIWVLLVLMILWVITVKYAEGPPSHKDDLVTHRIIEARENSFLMNHTESKWGTE